MFYARPSRAAKRYRRPVVIVLMYRYAGVVTTCSRRHNAGNYTVTPGGECRATPMVQSACAEIRQRQKRCVSKYAAEQAMRFLECAFLLETDVGAPDALPETPPLRAHDERCAEDAAARRRPSRRRRAAR